jgi:hypothetical protein
MLGAFSASAAKARHCVSTLAAAQVDEGAPVTGAPLCGALQQFGLTIRVARPLDDGDEW